MNPAEIAEFWEGNAGEPSASEEVARAIPTVADTRIAGLFLHVQVAQPKTLAL